LSSVLICPFSTKTGPVPAVRPDLPDATETVADGGQTGLKVFINKLIEVANLPTSGDQVCS